MMFETVPAAKRVRLLTFYNFASSLAIVAGAAIGARLLQLGGFEFEAYHRLFALSTVGRMACVTLLVPVVFPSVLANWNLFHFKPVFATSTWPTPAPEKNHTCQ